MKKIFILVFMPLLILFYTNFVFADFSNGTYEWVDVPLTNTNPFDINCEYRVFYKSDYSNDGRFLGYIYDKECKDGADFDSSTPSVLYATAINKSLISFRSLYYTLRGGRIDVTIRAHKKGSVCAANAKGGCWAAAGCNTTDCSSNVCSWKIEKLQKRCSILNPIPSGAINMFALKNCPDGWSRFNGSNLESIHTLPEASVIVCKKD